MTRASRKSEDVGRGEVRGGAAGDGGCLAVCPWQRQRQWQCWPHKRVKFPVEGRVYEGGGGMRATALVLAFVGIGVGIGVGLGVGEIWDERCLRLWPGS
jgi:hypothetical protein